MLVSATAVLLYWWFDSSGSFVLVAEALVNWRFDWTAVISIIFWDFLMFYQIFASSQVKQCAIIAYKHSIYELPHELPNHLTLRILGN